MRKIQSIYRVSIVLICFITMNANAQSPKGKFGTFALTNAVIETITNGTIANGTVIISNGKITAVGANIPVPSGAEVINCNGQRIYPGMIDGGTRAGLLEIGQIPQATDVREKGDVIPQMKALTAVNPNATVIPRSEERRVGKEC